MANIFSKKDQYIDRVNRSTFDLSFVNNFTTNFGVITPVCLLPVGFGDSVQINAKFNLQLMPTVFPIQTQMYARLHFVYVRTRTIWKDWQKFFGGDETVVPPYISFNSQTKLDAMAQTSTLGDYLGLPTTIVGKYGRYSSYPAYTPREWSYTNPLSAIAIALNTVPVTASAVDLQTALNNKYASIAAAAPRGDEGIYGSSYNWYAFFTPATGQPFYPSQNSDNPYEFSFSIDFAKTSGSLNNTEFNNIAFVSWAQENGDIVVKKLSEVSTASPNGTVTTWNVIIPLSEVTGNVIRSLALLYPKNSAAIELVLSPSNPSYNNPWTTNFAFSGFLNVIDTTEQGKVLLEKCPWYDGSTESKSVRISALPFRVYEAYYNAFGRDVRNNPFMINGKAEYNQYVPTLDGGADGESYELHRANWEPDAYTTALQSPQAGVAPLVGISSLGEATFRDANGTTYTAQLETAEDGDTVTGFQMKSSDAPSDVVRNLIGMATSGISISDFRNVNSLQRFLEIRIRQSPRYLNLVKGLFNVNLDYDELMMPEFLGGISDNVPVYKVTQTTPTDGSPLGSFAGQGFIQSGMKHVIRKYCPEEGYILGVLSVVPAANYSQLLAPHWTRTSLLDWHFPQFNNVSFQPMLYKNLCPLQAYNQSPSSLSDVYGYQRAWWDLISSFDEVHGQFRTSLRNFVINRVFDTPPQLSKDFLLVDPAQVNDVFAVTAENGDKILGSIAFDITKKTTIPRNSIPHIE